MKNTLLKTLIILLIIDAIIIVILFAFKYSNIKKSDIIKFELQTHEYFNNLPKEEKYLINSKEELNKFYEIYSDKLNINEKYLKDSTVFITVKQSTSGSNKYKLIDVNFDNNKVNFKIEENIKEIGTMDMAFWYLVAIIPNEKINGLNIEDWTIPSKSFNLSSENKYKIITDSRWNTMQNDGGSNTNIYYEIDLDKDEVSKIEEVTKANKNTKTNTIYKKNITKGLNIKIKNLMTSLINNEDINSGNYSYFTIQYFNNKKDIYNLDSIKLIKDLLLEIDNSDKNKKLILTINYKGIKCLTPTLYIYNDNTYEFYNTFSNDEKYIEPIIGTFNYDLNNILNDIGTSKTDAYSNYIVTDNKQNTYEVNDNFEPINKFLSEININLKTCE